MAKRDISSAKINQVSHNNGDRLNKVTLKYLLKKSAEKIIYSRRNNNDN